MKNQEREVIYKVLVVGDPSVGKSSLIKRYVHNTFSPNYRSTIGVDFALKIIKWDDKTNVRLQLWDIAGQERFGNMTRVYYKEAVAAIVVYDVTRISTFDGIKRWKTDIDSKITLPYSEQSIPAILIANKCDLIEDYVAHAPKCALAQTDEEMDKFCRDNGFISWVYTSAKDNTGINDAINQIVASIIEFDPCGSIKNNNIILKPCPIDIKPGTDCC